MSVFSAFGDFYRGQQESEDRLRRRRRENYDLFRAFSEDNPFATAADLTGFAENISGGSNYLRGGLPQAQMLEAIGERNRTREDAWNQQQQLDTISRQSDADTLIRNMTEELWYDPNMTDTDYMAAASGLIGEGPLREYFNSDAFIRQLPYRRQLAQGELTNSLMSAYEGLVDFNDPTQLRQFFRDQGAPEYIGSLAETRAGQIAQQQAAAAAQRAQAEMIAVTQTISGLPGFEEAAAASPERLSAYIREVAPAILGRPVTGEEAHLITRYGMATSVPEVLPPDQVFARTQALLENENVRRAVEDGTVGAVLQEMGYNPQQIQQITRTMEHLGAGASGLNAQVDAAVSAILANEQLVGMITTNLDNGVRTDPRNVASFLGIDDPNVAAAALGVVQERLFSLAETGSASAQVENTQAQIAALGERAQEGTDLVNDMADEEWRELATALVSTGNLIEPSLLSEDDENGIDYSPVVSRAETTTRALAEDYAYSNNGQDLLNASTAAAAVVYGVEQEDPLSLEVAYNTLGEERFNAVRGNYTQMMREMTTTLLESRGIQSLSAQQAALEARQPIGDLHGYYADLRSNLEATSSLATQIEQSVANPPAADNRNERIFSNLPEVRQRVIQTISDLQYVRSNSEAVLGISPRDVDAYIARFQETLRTLNLARDGMIGQIDQGAPVGSPSTAPPDTIGERREQEAEAAAEAEAAHQAQAQNIQQIVDNQIIPGVMAVLEQNAASAGMDVEDLTVVRGLDDADIDLIAQSVRDVVTQYASENGLRTGYVNGAVSAVMGELLVRSDRYTTDPTLPADFETALRSILGEVMRNEGLLPTE